jgi:hypothetical protein
MVSFPLPFHVVTLALDICHRRGIPYILSEMMHTYPHPYDHLVHVPHHHIVFTIPKLIRRCFLIDRRLLADLSR